MLASINKIETAFGTNLNVSSAGAVGWMQFLPSTWETYGVDANGDGRKDPYNPVDAICAAARYLKAAGGSGDLYNAILAYNHADWYVQEVLLYARAYGKLPHGPGRLADRAHRGRPLPGRRRRPLRRRHLGPRGAAALAARSAGRVRQRRRRDLLLADPARDQHLRRRGGAGRRRQRRRDREDGQLRAARPLHRPPGRLRQPLHLREAGRDRPRPSLGRDAYAARRSGSRSTARTSAPASTPFPAGPQPGVEPRPRKRSTARRRRAPTEPSRSGRR